jgi:hypothetical protein
VTVVTNCDRFGFAECACHLLVSTASGASRTSCKNINIDAIYLLSHPKKHILVNSIADDVVTTWELVQLVQPLHSQPACADLLALTTAPTLISTQHASTRSRILACCSDNSRPATTPSPARPRRAPVGRLLAAPTRASADGGSQDVQAGTHVDVLVSGEPSLGSAQRPAQALARVPAHPAHATAPLIYALGLLRSRCLPAARGGGGGRRSARVPVRGRAARVPRAARAHAQRSVVLLVPSARPHHQHTHGVRKRGESVVLASPPPSLASGRSRGRRAQALGSQCRSPLRRSRTCFRSQ